MAHIASKYAQFVSRTKLNKNMTMGTLRMCYEYFFRIFTKSLLLSMHIYTVTIRQKLFLDKLFFLNFHQFHPHYKQLQTATHIHMIGIKSVLTP